MIKDDLARVLAEFFLDSCREDDFAVDTGCIQGKDSMNDIVTAIHLHFRMKL